LYRVLEMLVLWHLIAWLYGILFHGYMASYFMVIRHLITMLIVLAPVITYFASALMLPVPSLWLVTCVLGPFSGKVYIVTSKNHTVT